MVEPPQPYDKLPPTPITMVPSTKNKTGGWRTFRPIIHIEKCIKCFNCWKFCPDVSVEIVDDMPKINYDFCKGCGVCANECPVKCIEMVLEE